MTVRPFVVLALHVRAWCGCGRSAYDGAADAGDAHHRRRPRSCNRRRCGAANPAAPRPFLHSPACLRQHICTSTTAARLLTPPPLRRAAQKFMRRHTGLLRVCVVRAKDMPPVDGPLNDVHAVLTTDLKHYAVRLGEGPEWRRGRVERADTAMRKAQADGVVGLGSWRTSGGAGGEWGAVERDAGALSSRCEPLRPAEDHQLQRGAPARPRRQARHQPARRRQVERQRVAADPGRRAGLPG
jgi:hypothetical protein